MTPTSLAVRLASRLRADAAVLAPGVYDALSAALVEEAGFEAGYLSGASIAYTLLGRPDIGLVSLTEVADTMARIRERVALPVIVDADTGWGNALNTQRTVRVLERAGASAIQLEDQSFPKRCGHLQDKRLIPVAEMAGKLRAAVDAREAALIIARTDAIGVEGFDAALDRAERYLESGADILFIEAPENQDQMRAITARFAGRVPLLANMVEGGRTPLASAEELGAMGFWLVIFPGGTVRALTHTLQAYFASLKRHGTTAPFQSRMHDFSSLNRMLGTDAVLERRARLRRGGLMDPVTLAVLKGRLEGIADEMDATLFRAAFNPTIAEAHDACHGLYEASSGATLVQGKSGLPIFVGVMAFAAKAVIDKFPDARDGDVFAFNDPYLGGTHLSDMRLIRPYMRDGKVFCWLGSVGHWHDLGGAVPGNYNPAATEYFQEAVLIPPVRLYAAGELRQDILDIILAASRLPDVAYGDMQAHLSALDLGAARMDALLDEYGAATVAEALRELRLRAAAQLRAELAALPDGTWSQEDFLDNDGRSDKPLRIAADVTIRGERLVIDFSRSAPACEGPVNISRATTVASVYVALKHLFPEVAANTGVLDPVEVIVPPGSLLDAQRPKPTGGYTETILRIIDVLFCAFARIRPDRAVANAYGTINALSLAGQRADGRRWVLFSFFGGGHGGNPEGDGLSHGNPPIATAIIPPVEILEAAYPVRYTSWALRDGSGGAGRHRGGLGAVYEIELLEGADAFVFAERARFAPKGVLGGGDGAMNRISYRQDGAWRAPALGSKVVGVHLAPGDRIRLESPGGGGWGAPGERDATAVANDLAMGYVDG